MARKLVCTVTGNWNYCSEARWSKLVEKFGSEDALRVNYISRAGKKVQEVGSETPSQFKNKIRCTVTGGLCYVSNARMKALIKKYESEDEVRKNYVSRVARRLQKQGVTVEDIQKMAKEGALPEPAAAKGTAKPPKARKVRVPAKARKTKEPKSDVVIDSVPTGEPSIAEPVSA